VVHHIVLAYSGGLDTSVGVHWLKEKHHAAVTCVLLDLGQNLGDLEAARERALRNGAEDCIIVDVKARFATDYVAPAILANARYEGAYPLATALGRPLIARTLVEVARGLGADAIAHGCTGKGNDQVRIEAAIAALAPDLVVLAPQRTDPMTRDAVLRYAQKHDLQVPPVKRSPYSVDENLWGRSVEGHDLEDPAVPVPEDAYSLTADPTTAPAEGAAFTLTFHAGLPIELDGKRLPLDTLIAKLNAIVGPQGIGRIDHVENRLVGIKTREVYEAPAAVAILTAKRALETLTLTRDEDHLKPFIEQTFASCVYDGKWFHPVMQPIAAFVKAVQAHVTGSVTLHACRGNLVVLSRSSPEGLVDKALATYEDGDSFHHEAATGFIELWALPQVVAARARRTQLAKVQP
jgi:argininosuccinate synthase